MMAVTPMLPVHADAVLAIYQQGIDGGDATFATTAPSWADFDSGHLPDHRFVAVDGDRVLGWVACSPTSKRAVYAGVVEESVYVHPDGRGQGVGRGLLSSVIASTEAAGIWTLRAGIFPENTASLALHEKAGFRVIGVTERVGRFHDGRWRDVVLLERRSALV
ncbi:GNAT family N-acetyltransferase [Kutzneria buriramensis]|uniref:Phosphinothricin acetyltransferase n=1 Tax=Kutzneria buriramensis TaxID=1045776 RepID=A0A3E0HA61_9PSEU|nr:GNAT family N-acetyltransferase [Kutzneria buriramensis]REH40937.1 phosphinothricin acetyltransferase [Kutzneria buriramensis]